MSFFKKLFGEESPITELTKQEAFVGILYAVIAADGQITQEESDDFITAVSRAKIMANITNPQWRDMIGKLSKIIKKQGPQELVLLAVKSIPEEIKAGIFAYACDLVFSDGYADETEQEILDIIKRELKIEDDLAYKVAEVVTIKNRV